MAVLLPDTLKTMTENFPAAEAKDVEITLTGNVKKRLQQAYEDGDLGGGEGLMAVETMPPNPEDGDTVLYTGTTGEYIKGHIYKYREYDNFYAYAEDGVYFVYVKDAPPSVGDDFYAVSSEEHKAKNASELNLVEGYNISEVNGDNIKTSTGDATYTRDSNADLGSYWEDITLSGIELVYDSSEIPANPEDNDVMFYLGDNTSTFIKNHFYKYIYTNDAWEDLTSVSNVTSIKSISELPSDSEIPENLEKGNIYILSQNDNDVKAGTMFSVGATEPSSTIASTYHYKFTNGMKIIYSSSSTIGENNVYIQSDNGYLFTSLINVSGNTYRPELYENDTSGTWDFNVNLPSTDEAVPTIAGWVALNEDTTTELAEQALAIASTAALQAKEAKDAITPHFTGTRNEVNSAISQNKIPDGAYVSVTDDIDQDYDTDYSTNEVKLANKWIDGKPIYRKVVDCGALPNTDEKLVPHNISNINEVIYINGISIWDKGSGSFSAMPINYINPTAIENSVGLYVNETNISLRTTSNLSVYTKTSITLMYTKSSD